MGGGRGVVRGLDLAEVLQHRVDELKGVVDLVPDLGTSEDDLAADEDKKHDLGLDHAVYKTGEQLRLVRAEVVVARCQTLEADGELDVTRANDVLDLEVRELGVEAYRKKDLLAMPAHQMLPAQKGP